MMKTIEELLKEHGGEFSGIWEERPICEVEGCNKLGQNLGRRRKDGSKSYRRKCHMHHSIQYGINGWEYKIYRKNYCENVDGRLGFYCTYTIPENELFELFLTVDHIDGNHKNHSEDNLQTLCHNCHSFKTVKNGDNLNRY